MSALDYIGLTVVEAKELARDNGVRLRVAEKDGQQLALTGDRKPGGIKAVVKDDRVISCTVEK